MKSSNQKYGATKKDSYDMTSASANAVTISKSEYNKNRKQKIADRELTTKI
jgi:hypothetical protein